MMALSISMENRCVNDNKLQALFFQKRLGSFSFFSQNKWLTYNVTNLR